MKDLTARDRAWRLPALSGDRDTLDLRRLWRAVWSHRWAVLALVLAALAATHLLLGQLTPQYTAQATLMIEAPRPLIRFASEEGGRGKVDGYMETQIDLLRSRAVAERVVRDLQLTSHPEFDPRQAEPLLDLGALLRLAGTAVGFDLPRHVLSEAEVHDRVVEALMARTEVSLQGKGKLVQITVTLADRLTAANAANALANAYIEDQLAAKVDMSMTAASWMNGRLEELRTALQESEKRLQAYLEAEGLVDVNGVATVSTNELSLTGSRMIEASRARAEAESQYRQVADMRGQGWERLASLPAILDNKLVQDFKAEVARANARVEDLSRRYGSRHPALQSARSDLAAATQSLRSQVEQVAASIERNYQLAQANERALRASFNDNKAEIQGIARKGSRLRELQRDVDSHRALYDTFVTRLRETNATSDLASTNARVVDPALPPLKPSSPKAPLFYAAAVLLALAAGIGGAIALEVFNDTLGSPDEVEAKLDLPVMGIVPLQPKAQAAEIPQFYRRNSDRRFSEAIRTIRTNIGLGDLGRTQQMLLITSTEPDEGKSSLATNLAFAMGQLQRVLLIDADLRRPTLARHFGFSAGTPGLANVIAGTATVESCIREVDGVDVLPAGTVPPNPLELLSSPRFAELLQSLRCRYDRILVDTPPTQAVSDATLLAGGADGVIYVIRADHTPAGLAHHGIGQLLQAGARIIGVVLNQFDVERARKQRQYSGYYDDYGYGDNTPEPAAAPAQPASTAVS